MNYQLNYCLCSYEFPFAFCPLHNPSPGRRIFLRDRIISCQWLMTNLSGLETLKIDVVMHQVYIFNVNVNVIGVDVIELEKSAVSE